MTFAEIHTAAHAAGIAAGQAARAQMVKAVDRDGTESEAFPICGFAWVNFAGNTAWGRWAQRNSVARAQYPTGLCVWVHAFNQSYDCKLAYAEAYASVLKSHGIDAYADGRLD